MTSKKVVRLSSEKKLREKSEIRKILSDVMTKSIG